MPRQEKILDTVRLEAIVRGVVQGVNFRWFTQRRAAALGLAGFVRNLPDGAVQIVAEGERAALECLIDALRVGPATAIVEHLDIHWSSPSGGLSRFEVRS